MSVLQLVHTTDAIKNGGFGALDMQDTGENRALSYAKIVISGKNKNTWHERAKTVDPFDDPNLITLSSLTSNGRSEYPPIFIL